MKRKSPTSCLLLFALLWLGSPACALEALDDGGMSEVSGAGITFAFDNFSFRMAPTSYIELTGTPMSSTVTTSCNAACVAAYAAGWRRGDVRYYGLSMTGNQTDATAGDWYGGPGGCVPGTDGLGCPLGGVIKDFASVYNPYMARVFQYAGFSYEGTCLGTVVSGVCSAVNAASPTFYEFIGPSKSDSWRWSFWGQLDIDLGGTNTFWHSQTIILGKNSTLDGKSTKLQLLQTPTAVASEQSLSLIYQSRLSGSFRFSLQKTGTSPDTKNVVPDFNDNEGVYFKNVNAFLPLGNMNYQTIVFRNTPSNNGNFIIELTPVPGASGTTGALANAYYTHYCGTSVACPTTTFTGGVNAESVNAGTTTCANTPFTWPCRRVNAFPTTDVVVTPANRNPDTHGYIHWGTPGADLTSAPVEGSTTDTANGIYFKNGTGAITNIGRAKIDGLMIQSLKITSLGAGT